MIVRTAPVFAPRSVLACFLLSLVSQFIAILSAICAGIAVHAAEPAVAYFAFVPGVWFVTMIPVTISGLGVREASFAFLFRAIGSPYEHGIAIGAMVSATSILAAALGGVFLFFKPEKAVRVVLSPTKKEP